MFKKPKGFADRNSYKNRWSDNTFKVENIDYDMTLNKDFIIHGVDKQFHRHELLLIND